MKNVPVLYLDIDGTVREGKDDPLGKFVNGPEDVRVFPEAIAMMNAWRADGGRIVGVTNQGGIALGIVNATSVIDGLMETQRQTGKLFDAIMICHHHPDAKDETDARCWCRKPKSGLVIEGAVQLGHSYPGECYPPSMALFVGDRPEDKGCAESVNIDFMDAKDWRARA